MAKLTRSARTAMLALALTLAGPASAHHVVWLDFTSFDLSAFPTVNGNSPPTSNDRTAIEDLVFSKMQEDFALFDIHLVRFQPNEGRYSRLMFRGTAIPGLFGQVVAANWLNTVSSADIYAGSLASEAGFRGANATTARIAESLAGTGSHELGHLLDLRHCHAAGDFVGAGPPAVEQTVCINPQDTNDQSLNFHLMASGSTTGLTLEQRASRDRFFSVHSSRRTLYRQLQVRNHWEPMPSVNGDARADVSLARFESPAIVRFAARSSNGSSFPGPSSTIVEDGGNRGDLFYQIAGSNVRARPSSSSNVAWTSLLPPFGTEFNLRSDAGDVGSIFRWGSVRSAISSGRQELFFGRPNGTTVSWFFHQLSSDPFNPTLLTSLRFTTDAGDQGDLFFGARAVSGATLEDLVVVKRDPELSGVTSIDVYRNTGSSLVGPTTTTLVSSFDADYVFLGDVDDDGDDDLVLGRVLSDTRVEWYVSPNRGNRTFSTSQFLWSADFGDAGHHFRLGDGDGDGRADLFVAIPTGRDGLTANPTTDTVRWSRAASNGAGFDTPTVWATDFGDEGDLFP